MKIKHLIFDLPIDFFGGVEDLEFVGVITPDQ
jgi:hypothetical protein